MLVVRQEVLVILVVVVVMVVDVEEIGSQSL